jgi:hypothetical protein
MAAVTLHAIERARDRFGLELSDQDKAELTRQAVDGAGLLAGQDRSAQFWLVEIRGVLMKAVVKGGTVTTVMPPRWTCREAKHTTHAPLRAKQSKRDRTRKARQSDPIAEGFEQG